DPDSFMRLVRLQQGFKAGHLVNVVQGDDSGMPLVIEWSRLFDAVIVALAAPLAPFVGWHRALYAAGVATGPISAGLLALALSFAIAPLAKRDFLWAIAIAAPLVPGIHNFDAFGVIHYHIAQPALVALSAGCALRAATGNRKWGLWAGIWGGFAIWLMPEAMPWALLAFVGLGWAWLFRPIGGTVLASGLGFFVTLGVALMLDPPHGGVSVAEVDRLSVVYAALGFAALVTALCLSLIDRASLSPAQRVSLGIAAALGSFGAWLWCYPAVALGPYALASPHDMHAFFGNITEVQPATKPGAFGALVGPGLLALLYACWQIYRSRRALPEAGAWGVVAVGAMLASGLTLRFIIFMPFPASFAVALLPLALREVSHRFANRPTKAMLARFTVLLSLVLAPTASAVTPALFDQASENANGPSCDLRHIAPLLLPATGHIVLTDVDYVPELLYRTGIIGVGSVYQHGIPGFLRDRAAWAAPSAGRTVPQDVTATGAQFVLFCPTGKAKAHAESLAGMLRENRTPDWLRLIGEQKTTGFRLYRVVR
ncbi:MAG TPA: hypothetical protein VMU81_22265, partial [Acetobacteraceae bacterium]|nr:hypothetical protein [Acetobacteraceae bacterium]